MLTDCTVRMPLRRVCGRLWVAVGLEYSDLAVVRAAHEAQSQSNCRAQSLLVFLTLHSDGPVRAALTATSTTVAVDLAAEVMTTRPGFPLLHPQHSAEVTSSGPPCKQYAESSHFGDVEQPTLTPNADLVPTTDLRHFRSMSDRRLRPDLAVADFAKHSPC